MNNLNRVTAAVFIGPAKENAIERDHYHCPHGCEHPQPFCAGMLILCGLCWFFRDTCTVMEPCTAEFCEWAGDLSGE
jgi:hypothetical protein